MLPIYAQNYAGIIGWYQSRPLSILKSLSQSWSPSRFYPKNSRPRPGPRPAFTLSHQYMPTSRDIEHYKLLSVHEQPLDNRQKYLDVLCFPTLFPTGRYGEFHPRPVKLAFSEYLKSRLMNTDSRFRKSPEFVFYYLWQKELRELSSGIYNVLKSSSRRSHTVKQFVDGISSADAGIEANLSTVLQSVRGTKQFWFRQKGDVLAMIREFGCPTLFLTLSCAEYNSVDMDRYLRKVNQVADSHRKIVYRRSYLCVSEICSKVPRFLSNGVDKGRRSW